MSAKERVRVGTSALRIAVVDDDRTILALLVQMLGECGHSAVTTFTNGEQALRHIRDTVVDLVLLDINMPHLDGVQFIRELRQFGFKGAVAIVSGDDPQLVEGVQQLVLTSALCLAGALAKPLRMKELSALMTRFTQRAAQHSGGLKRSYGSAQLRNAIARGELVNHYHPIVSLSTGALVRIEALVRWRHPTDGLIYPDELIPLAAEHGLLAALTRTVVANALEDASRWSEFGQTHDLAVNVTLEDFSCLTFPDEVEALARDHGVPPSSMTFEVSESQATATLERALDVINRLRLKRFRLSLDDFGAGHSSLAQLRLLPFNEIKLDRGLVCGVAGDQRLQAICKASIRMAKQLGLYVVAEGIEDIRDWELLQSKGCDAGQGYLIAKPAAAAHLGEMLEGWESRRMAAARRR
ncbi:MAG TPA: EAL domain-containing response regulator [Steroidobacteraceae bacterium]|nr:EAL domain-containing response regulator [Steroidobacteraceae bacterium]